MAVAKKTKEICGANLFCFLMAQILILSLHFIFKTSILYVMLLHGTRVSYQVD